MDIIEKQFEKLANRIKFRFNNVTERLNSYFRKLLLPLYLFPIKFVTYTIYYLIKFLIKFVLAVLKLIVDLIKFPFRSLKNLLKSIFIFGLVIYMFASLFVILDYLTTQYGNYTKFFCTFGIQNQLKGKVVRVVGGYSEGTGFFVSENQVLTNFHVITDEPSPKIIFPDGSFVTPTRIIGDSNSDLALLFTQEHYPNLVLPIAEKIAFYDNEPVIATGYALGTDLIGKATSVKGNFIDFKRLTNEPLGYIQTNINLVPGMSGGPLTDQCGKVEGISTLGLSGLSLFITANDAMSLIPTFTDQDVAKIEVDPSASPEDAVTAFYTYLKARRMQDGFNLLSSQYLQKTNFEEWTNRFKDILDVEVIKTERYENTKDTAFVKFSTKNWVEGEVQTHYYEGTWQTIKEDGVYKMLKSKISEVDNPSWDWFYE